MTSSDRGVRLLFGASLILLGAYALARIELSTDITSFLPRESDAELAKLASKLADSELTRTMILTLGSRDLDTSVEAARALSQRLADHDEVAELSGGPSPELFDALYRIYFPHRYGFLSEAPEREIPELTGDAALHARARQVRTSLGLPSATLTKRLVAEDPLGAFERLLERVQGQRGPLALHDGHFVSADRSHAVLFLTTRHSAFDSKPQEALLADLSAAFAAVSDAHPGAELVLEASGSNRFAVAAERSMERDIVRIAALSLLGVAAVFLAFLRSLHYFALAMLPPLAGILTAAVATHVVLGRVDGLTLAFGASLVGVAIDYSIHVIDHQRFHPKLDARAVVWQLRPALVLGALTTMASFAGLGLTSFPGFREIGLLAILGVGASLLVTLVVLPAFLSRAREAPPLARRTAAGLLRRLERLRPHRLALGLAMGFWALAAASELPRLHFDDDLSQLMDVDPALRAEEQRVRERVTRSDTSRVVLALGADEEQALERNAAVAARLAEARRAGAVGELQTLHGLLWSRALQERNQRTLRAQPQLAERVEAAFAAGGFRPEALAPFRADLSRPPPPPLEAAALRDSPLRTLLAPLLIDLGDRVAAVTTVSEAADLAALEAFLADLEGVHVFDQARFLDSIYGEFRDTTLRQLGVGCALVIAVLALRYRRWRPVLAAFLPSLLVALSLLAGFAAFGVSVNLLHATSLILVMGMGVDYGIFMVDSAGRRASLEATLLSLLLSCLTTVCVFGTLALSEHTALSSIGTTTGLGVLLSLLFAPLALVLLQPEGEAARA